jgi:hypothetical protein
MKIDSSRYTMFWANPERYRLREVWKLAPIEKMDDPKTFGRRRGTCFHEMRDAVVAGRTLDQAAAELRDGGYGEKEIAVARQMAEKIAEVYPNEEYLAHEVLFEYAIPDSPHSMVGRIDHLIRRDGEVFVGDWKTSKYRSASDAGRKLAEYCAGAQVGFYLLGARSLGFEPSGFIYRLVLSGRDNTGVSIREQATNRTSIELREFARQVHLTCELIEFLKTFDTERPWPTLNEQWPSGYEPIQGKRMYEGFTPDGYQPKKEHLELMKEAQ